MSLMQTALDRIAFSRRYTLGLLDGVPEAEWFRMPAEGVTHVAWQVGHLAMAEYRLASSVGRPWRAEASSSVSRTVATLTS